MITYLFWNINGQPILARVAEIVSRRGVDILLLAECEADESAVLATLARAGATGWAYPPVIAQGRVKVFSRLPAGSVVEYFATRNGRLTIREVRRIGCEPFLLAAVHLASKAGGWTDHSQSSAARGVAEAVERVEGLHQNPRTVLIGDFKWLRSRRA